MAILSGCSQGTKVDQINISYVKLPLNVPSIVERQKNMFEDEFGKDDMKIAYSDITAGPKMTEAMAAGSLDFANALGATSALLAASNGVDLKIIGVYSRAPKSFTIMSTNPDIKTAADLKGKTVVGPKGTILHQLLLAAADKEGLAAADYNYVNMDINAGVSALLAGSADAALVAGPSVIQAEKSGAHIVTTGDGYLDATIVIAVRGQFLTEHKDLVKRYLDVHNKALQFMKENQAETYQIVADETGLTVDEVKVMYEMYDFNPEITDKDLQELEKTQQFLLDNEMMTNKVDIKSLIMAE
ncbi:MAG TPA: NrtA/SsuA/CpmA family ABC transporter substrate-binding protein [Clostridiaceae bacterium]|nr:NrtA/SsuA/CpmA family ABC transporter substrate-binding protein [Clostridiaceae bacterium]